MQVGHHGRNRHRLPGPLTRRTTFRTAFPIDQLNRIHCPEHAHEPSGLFLTTAQLQMGGSCSPQFSCTGGQR